MANSLQRMVILTTVVSAIMLAATCQEEGDKQPPGGKPVPGNSGVLPDVPVTPGETGVTDVNNMQVTGGLVGLVSPIFWPFTFTTFEALDFILRNFVGQKLPCTVWSLVPPRVACTALEGPGV